MSEKNDGSVGDEVGSHLPRGFQVLLKFARERGIVKKGEGKDEKIRFKS